MALFDTLRLKSKDPAARRKAVENLAECGNSNAFELLVNSLAD